MTGQVNDDYEPLVEIVVRSGESSARISAVVDTGFSEFLMLPASMLRMFDAKAEDEAQVILGDGSMALLDVYIIEIEWLCGWRTVKTLASEGDALVGMKHLMGHDLHVRVVTGSAVDVRPVTSA